MRNLLRPERFCCYFDIVGFVFFLWVIWLPVDGSQTIEGIQLLVQAPTYGFPTPMEEPTTIMATYIMTLTTRFSDPPIVFGLLISVDE